MSNVATSPDFVTIVTNIGVFLAAIGTVIAAIWGAAKKIKSALPEDSASSTKIVGGSIMDTATMLLFTESQREIIQAVRENTREIVELRHSVDRLKDAFDG